MTWLIAIVLKPFIAVVILCGVRLLALWIRDLLPDGRLKRFLFFSWRV